MVRVTEGKIAVNFQGNSILVPVSASVALPRVRVIGSELGPVVQNLDSLFTG